MIVFASPAGDDAAPGTEDRPVKTLAKAYTLATDSVYLMPGVFQSQKIPSVASPDKPHVVFGGEGTFGGQLLCNASHVTFRSLKFGQSQRLGTRAALRVEGGRDVRVEDCSGSNWILIGADDVWIRGGEWGPADWPCQVNDRCGAVRIAGGTYVDFHAPAGSDQHMEAIHVTSCRSLAIIGAGFERADNFHVFLKPFPAGHGIAETFIVGNHFGAVTGTRTPYGLAYADLFGPKHVIWDNYSVAPFRLPAGSLQGRNYIAPRQ